jgi:hypothetical protein
MRKPWLPMLLFLPLLLSCGHPRLPSLLVLLDPYSAELLRAEGLDAASLRRELRGSWRLRVSILEAQEGAAAEAEADRLCRAADPDWVFLGPLLPLDAEALAARLPGAGFVREQESAPRAANLRRLKFRREEAFRDAGTAAARLLTRPALRGVLGEGAARGRPKAGVLQAVSTPQGARDAQAFREGFLREAGEELLVERTIGSLSDTGQARRALERMREEGVAIFLLKTYALSGFCLEFLRSEGGLAILEQAAGRRAFPAQVLLWLEEDLAGALRSLASAPEGEAVAGPVRLRPGEPLRSLREPAARAELGLPELAE